MHHTKISSEFRNLGICLDTSIFDAVEHRNSDGKARLFISFVILNVDWITVWKNEKFTVAQKKFRQINSLVFSIVKTVLSRNFCHKSVRVNFHNTHCGNCGNLLSHFFDKNFVKVPFLLKKILKS